MKLIVLRHGESQFNHEHRFGGWIDVPLSAKGEREAAHAGQLLLENGLMPDLVYSLMLQRSIKTAHVILEQTHRMYVQHIKSWRLNERHYGSFQGQRKHDVYEKYGQQKYNYYRRDFKAVPPKIDGADSSIDERYAHLPQEAIPQGELLEMTMRRMMPLLDDILAKLRDKTVLVVTHGSVVRSLIKHFAHVSDADIAHVNAPTGVPLVFEFSLLGQLTRHYYLDEELARRGMAKVAREGMEKAKI